MSLNDHPIDDVKPEADLQEQERLAEEVPEDPEAPNQIGRASCRERV